MVGADRKLECPKVWNANRSAMSTTDGHALDHRSRINRKTNAQHLEELEGANAHRV